MLIVKDQARLILLLVSINLAVCCLVTNCPRGGKRSMYDVLANNLALKKISYSILCDSKNINREFWCPDENHCIQGESECPKRPCTYYEFCKINFPSVITKLLDNLKPNSLLLAKILSDQNY